KGTDVLPAETRNRPGTESVGRLLSISKSKSAVAGRFNTRAQGTDSPASMDSDAQAMLEERDSEVSWCEISEIEVVRDDEPIDAVRIADPSEAIMPAATVNVVVVAPAATVTEAGTVRPVKLLDIATAVPPAAANFDKLTAQVELELELNEVGVHWSEE